MASSTRTQIRQEAAARLGAIAYPYPCTAASGSTTTAVVNEFIDSVDSEYLHAGGWAYFLTPAGNLGEVRRVQSYAPASGTLTFNRALGTAVASTHTFEIHYWFDPRIWNDCINRALRNTPKERRDQITIVTNQTEYALSSFTWFVKKSQARRLILREGSTSLEYRYRELPSWMWHIEADEDAFTLVLTDSLASSSSLAMFLDSVGSYDTLSTDAATTTCDLDWIVFGTLKQAYDVYGQIISSVDKRSVLIDHETVMRKHQQLTREFGPKWNPPLRIAPPGAL